VVALARPQELVGNGSLSPATVSALLKPAGAFYSFGNNGSGALLGEALVPTFTYHMLPPGSRKARAGRQRPARPSSLLCPTSRSPWCSGWWWETGW
jgi:hypothetical protein